MLIKICGITNIDDAKFALETGADWIGLNLVGGPRRIDLTALAGITSKLDDVSRVVVLVHLSGDQVEPSLLSDMQRHGITRLQLYGEASAATFEQLAREGFASILAQSVSDVDSLDSLAGLLAICDKHKPDHILIDAGTPDQLGGTGRPLDWERLGKERAAGRFTDWPPILLAGGLTPVNVAEAIRVTSPAGVDVSSGVELGPGRKDHAKVERFVQTTRGTDRYPT